MTVTIKKLRDRNGELLGSYLGDNGRYYTLDTMYYPEDVKDEQGGILHQKGDPQFDFTLIEMTDEEVAEVAVRAAQVEAENAMSELRHERNRRLAETDWWANSDLTMTEEQTAYRQALRDITETYSSLDDVVWPTKP